MQTDPSVLEQLDKAHAGWTKKVIKRYAIEDDEVNIISNSKIGTEITFKVRTIDYHSSASAYIGDVCIDYYIDGSNCDFGIEWILRSLPFKVYLMRKTPPYPIFNGKRMVEFEMVFYYKEN